MSEPREDEAWSALLEESVQLLRRGSSISALLMLASMAILVVTTVSSVLRLRSLDAEIDTRQARLRQLERSSLALVDEKVMLERAIARARQEATDPIASPPAGAARVAPGANTSATTPAAPAVTTLPGAVVLSAAAGTARDEPLTLDMAVTRLFSTESAVRVRAYESLMAYHGSDPALVPRLVDEVRSDPGNIDGIYNALVVLNNLHPAALEPDAALIRDLAEEVQSRDARFNDLISILRLRLPPEAPAAQ